MNQEHYKIYAQYTKFTKFLIAYSSFTSLLQFYLTDNPILQLDYQVMQCLATVGALEGGL